jgi:HAE1 family hydrophobic/amphiphilic exporter-1
MAVSSLSVRRPISTLMAYAGVVFLGIVSFRQISVDFLPPVVIPRLTIHTTCPDLSPEEVDKSVAQPIASIGGSILGVKKTSSIACRGRAMVSLEFSWGTDMDYAMLEVRERLDQLRGELPREAGRPTILRVDPATEPVMTIGVTTVSFAAGSTSLDLMGLTETCHALLKKRLEQVEGVAQATVLGGVEREIWVEPDENGLMALGLTNDDLARAIALENVSPPGSTIRNGFMRYPLRLLGGLKNAEEVAGLSFFCGMGGQRVRVGDICTVRDTIGERGGWTRYNGKDILVIQVRKEPDSNTLVVSEYVREVLEQLEQENRGLRLYLLSDQAEFIRDSVADVQQSIFWGAVLAFLVLLLFLKGVRDPCIVGVTMPVSILATFAGMHALGITLNVLSLTGLALGIGMLGDNAIIVIENVRRLRDVGFPLLQAIEEGSHEINLAVTASTMTNVAVFLPVLLVRSVAQQLFADLAVTMTVSLLVSLFVAVTLVPVLLAQERCRRRPWTLVQTPLLVRGTAACRIIAGRLDAWCGCWQEKMLRHALTARALVLLSTGALFIASLVIAALIRSEPAPEIDRKRFIVQVTLDPGTPPSLGAQLAGRIENRLLAIDGVSSVYSAGGMASNTDVWSISDASVANLRLEVTIAENMQTASVMEQARSWMNALSGRLAGVEWTVVPSATTFERILRPQSSDITIRVQGKDPAICDRVAEEFARHVQGLPGLVDLTLPTRDRAPEYRLQIDRCAVARYGVSPQDVAEHVARQTAGGEATVLSDVNRRVVVRVQRANLKQATIQDLLSSSILCRGTHVPLSLFVTATQDLGRTEIRREDGTQTVAFTANVAGRSIGAVADDVRKEAALCALPSGYKIMIGGENEEMESSFRSLALVIGLSLLVVYMILAAEYESLVYPLVILLTSPLAFIGAVLAMLVAGERYNVMSLVGLVIMIGAVDNDAVIAVDIITVLRRSGMELHDAVCRGMRQRLRPILMTAGTSLLGIVPLMMGLGRGSELVRALTVPLAGGLITSTLFVLIVIPVVYTYIDSWAVKAR